MQTDAVKEAQQIIDEQGLAKKVAYVRPTGPLEVQLVFTDSETLRLTGKFASDVIWELAKP